ncbi:zinc-binding dehydrogenase [Paracoccus methylarcula]|uniref:zinc-binding dehydrogenase n=1 Tax=Paracoccus methylarcula TaxID=72022 RepID=UPI0026BEC670
MTAVEIGRALGARVIGIARGAEKLRTIREAGAEEVIDSADCPDLKAALRDLGGVDVVYDPVGGAPGAAAFGALRRGGRFLVIGFAAGRRPELPLNHALVKNIAIHGLYWGGYDQLEPAALRNSLSDLFRMFESGRLNPEASSPLPLSRLAEGYEMLRSRRAVGKILISL